ncbi:MAG: hypothetical protein Kow0069_05700 [Promethearchaeota archaeon]
MTGVALAGRGVNANVAKVEVGGPVAATAGATALAFKYATTPAGTAHLAREWRVVAWLRRAGVAGVYRPFAFRACAQGFPRSFLAREWVPGRVASFEGPRGRKVLRRLASKLAELHQVGWRTYGGGVKAWLAHLPYLRRGASER